MALTQFGRGTTEGPGTTGPQPKPPGSAGRASSRWPRTRTRSARRAPHHRSTLRRGRFTGRRGTTGRGPPVFDTPRRVGARGGRAPSRTTPRPRPAGGPRSKRRCGQWIRGQRRSPCLSNTADPPAPWIKSPDREAAPSTCWPPPTGGASWSQETATPLLGYLWQPATGGVAAHVIPGLGLRGRPLTGQYLLLLVRCL